MNIAVVTNMSKAHGGEALGLSKLFKMYDFKDCDKVEADLTIVLTGGQEQELMREYLPYLKSKIAWWQCDFRHPSHFQRLPMVDYVFIPYKNYLKDYQKLAKNGAYYLPQSGYVWNEEVEVPEDIDAVFIGNVRPNQYHGNRESILNEISKHCNVDVISRGETTKEQSSVYRQVPLSIAISSDEIIGGCSNRLYNIVKAGGCAFVKYFKGLEDLFENHKHLIWFKDESEIPELLDYYLNNRDKIGAIKRQAKEYAEEKHSIESRIEQIIKHINK
jgi:hypothetical protein